MRVAAAKDGVYKVDMRDAAAEDEVYKVDMRDAAAEDVVYNVDMRGAAAAYTGSPGTKGSLQPSHIHFIQA